LTKEDLDWLMRHAVIFRLNKGTAKTGR